MTRRTRGRRVPSRQPSFQGSHHDLPPSDVYEMAMNMLAASRHYLMQRSRYLDISDVTRLELGPQVGMITFWIDMYKDQPPIDICNAG